MWSPQQDEALKAVDKWFYNDSKKKPVFSLQGFAGTGKTTLAKHFAENIDGDTLFGAFTGKASLVMRKNGCIGARTLHSMLYLPEEDKNTGEVTWHLNRGGSPLNDCSLLIVDECSMVDPTMAKDLLSFNVPIIALGDPAQLPPISGQGYFTNMKPDVMLTEIHRQAKDNPIIHLATMLRNGQMPDLGEYGESRVIPKLNKADFMEADQVLVGRNITRNDMNKKMRKLLGYDSDKPLKDEKLVCLKNDKDLGIFNGEIFTVLQEIQQKYKTQFLHYALKSDDEDKGAVMVKVHGSFFQDEVPVPDWKFLKGSQELDYAYVLSVHKAQGSQWDNVLLLDESYCFRDDKWKWLYTGVTRAAEKVVVVAN